uniref:Uncharacterized protein n=1 Tax=Plectus sambesii TaxID=2011161 RepID=A0A914WXV0_9BILA
MHAPLERPGRRRQADRRSRLSGLIGLCAESGGSYSLIMQAGRDMCLVPTAPRVTRRAPRGRRAPLLTDPVRRGDSPRGQNCAVRATVSRGRRPVEVKRGPCVPQRIHFSAYSLLSFTDDRPASFCAQQKGRENGCVAPNFPPSDPALQQLISIVPPCVNPVAHGGRTPFHCACIRALWPFLGQGALNAMTVAHDGKTNARRTETAVKHARHGVVMYSPPSSSTIAAPAPSTSDDYWLGHESELLGRWSPAGQIAGARQQTEPSTPVLVRRRPPVGLVEVIVGIYFISRRSAVVRRWQPTAHHLRCPRAPADRQPNYWKHAAQGEDDRLGRGHHQQRLRSGGA